MKSDTLLILAAAAAGLYVVTRMTRRPAPGSTAMALNQGGNVSIPGTVKQIFNTATPGTPGWGWQYYTDGTAIGPDGSYYSGGEKVWSPT